MNPIVKKKLDECEMKEIRLMLNFLPEFKHNYYFLNINNGNSKGHTDKTKKKIYQKTKDY